MKVFNQRSHRVIPILVAFLCLHCTKSEGLPPIDKSKLAVKNSAASKGNPVIQDDLPEVTDPADVVNHATQGTPMGPTVGELKVKNGITEVDWGTLAALDFQSGKPFPTKTATDKNEKKAVQNLKKVLKLGKKKIKVAGIPYPLDSKKNVSNFMILAYMPTCMHVPPPTPNQMMKVQLKKPVPLNSLIEPIGATGKMKVIKDEGIYTYQLVDTEIETYEEDF